MLNKQDVMNFLRECADLNNKYSLVEAREEYLTNTIKKIDKGPESGDIPYKDSNESILFGVIASSFLLGLMGTPIAALIIAIFARPSRWLYDTFHFAFANAHPFWTHILFSFVLTSILAIPLAIAMCKDQKKGSVERFNSYQSALAERPALVQELASIPQQKQAIQSRLNQLSAKGILHHSYFVYADRLWWYFEQGRADTLKEALNLLEHDLAEDARREDEREYRKEIRQIAKQQQDALSDIADETARVADAAQSAAAWSAAGTLLTAAEIERQKKKERN